MPPSHLLLADLGADLKRFVAVALVAGLIGFGMTIVASRRKKPKK